MRSPLTVTKPQFPAAGSSGSSTASTASGSVTAYRFAMAPRASYWTTETGKEPRL
jgi:hypothetical protein